MPLQAPTTCTNSSTLTAALFVRAVTAIVQEVAGHSRVIALPVIAGQLSRWTHGLGRCQMVSPGELLVGTLLAQGRHREIVDDQTAGVVLTSPPFEDDLGGGAKKGRGG